MPSPNDHLAITTPGAGFTKIINVVRRIPVAQDDRPELIDTSKPNGIYVQCRIDDIALLMTGKSIVHGDSYVNGALNIESDSLVKGNMSVEGNAEVSGDFEIKGNTTIHGRIHSNSGLSFDGDLTVRGDISATGDIFLRNADFAEDFDILDETCEAGSVMVLSVNGGLVQSTAAYDRKVAGVISGAGSYKPGIILDRQLNQAGRLPLAMVGKVYCKVDANYGSIEIGDLLTTSDTIGYAMKASDPSSSFGAIVGKSLGHLSQGRGLIPILVALQ